MVPTVTRLRSLLGERSGTNLIGRQKQLDSPLVGTGHSAPPERFTLVALPGAVGKSLSNALRRRESDRRAVEDRQQVRHNRMMGRMLLSILLTMYCSRVPKGLF